MTGLDLPRLTKGLPLWQRKLRRQSLLVAVAGVFVLVTGCTWQPECDSYCYGGDRNLGVPYP